MTNKTPGNTKGLFTFRIPQELRLAIDQLYERDGIAPSETVRRALVAFLTTKGVLEMPKPKKVARG